MEIHFEINFPIYYYTINPLNLVYLVDFEAKKSKNKTVA